MRFIIIFLLMSCTGFAQKPLSFRDSTSRGPQTFAIIVGISKYKFVRPLTYADKDAELFRDYLKSPGGGSVKDDNIFCLLNEQANNLNFWGKGFQWLKAKNLQRGDKLFIYLAGHGDAIDEDQFFFLGYDCNPGGDKNNYLVSGAIQLFNLKKKIANETSRGVEVVFVMDACRSDELPGGTAGQNFLNSAVTEKKAGEIIMLATGAGQESLEDASIGNGHGLFTYYLIDGLVGAADSVNTLDQQVTFEEIQTYVSGKVPLIAQQRFRRTQEPFFCCNENSDKVIGLVNLTYFQQWKSRQRGRGNSVGAERDIPKFLAADTLLLETYNRFNTAIRNYRLTGPSSAEEYYAMLQKKFPGNGYTLDARSTLAVEFANIAQKLVDDFIGCQVLSNKRKTEYLRAAEGLEKAIAFFKLDEVDFANSLYGRLYLLKALGSEATNQQFRYAHAARAFDPSGAYAHYILGSLYLGEQIPNSNSQIPNPDSAQYYAERAAAIAPNWPCAVSLLALANQKAGDPASKTVKKTLRGPKFGVMIAGGVAEPVLELTEVRDPAILSIEPRSQGIIEGGLSMAVVISDNLSFRPIAQVSFVSGRIVYQRRFQTGGPVITENVATEYISINLPLGLVYHFGKGKTRPYIAVAPTPSFAFLNDFEKEMFQQFSILGEASLGVEIRPRTGGISISPELRYNMAITDQKANANTLEGISGIKRKSFTFTIHIGRR